MAVNKYAEQAFVVNKWGRIGVEVVRIPQIHTWIGRNTVTRTSDDKSKTLLIQRYWVKSFKIFGPMIFTT